MKYPERKLVVIAGATASGKSSLALKLAERFNGVIINADSRQIYSETNIGTDKPAPEKVLNPKKWLVDGIEHYLYGFLPISEQYNISQYQKDMTNILALIDDRQQPFLVGGTGLYIDSVVHSYQLPSNRKFDESVLEQLEIHQLHQIIGEDQLEKLNESDRMNKHRLVQAARRGVVDKEDRMKEHRHLYLQLEVSMEEIEVRIKLRVEAMFENGLVEENKKLIDAGYDYATTPGLRSIGYKEFAPYFEGDATIEEVKEQIYLHTRQYAKRQLTWFKRNKEIVPVKSFDEATAQIENFLMNS